MTEPVKLLVSVLGTAIPVFGSYWVWRDAHRLQRNRATITPILWAVIVLFFWSASAGGAPGRANR